MRRALVLALAAVATVMAAVVLWRLRTPLLILLAAIAMAGAAHPFVLTLRTRGLGRLTAIASVYTIGALSVAAFWMAFGGALLDELRTALDALTVAYDRLIGGWARGSYVERGIAAALPNPRRLAATAGHVDPTRVAEGALDVGGGALVLLSQVLLAVVLSACWAGQRDSIWRLCLSFIPAQHRTEVRRVAWDLELGVGRALFSEAVRVAFSTVVLALSFRAIGLQHPTLTAVVAGGLVPLPLLGAALGTMAAYFAGAATAPAIAVPAAFVAALVLLPMQLAWSWRLLGERRHHPILVMLMMIALSAAFGLNGYLLAPAAAAALQILGERLLLPVHRIPAPVTLEDVRERLAALKTRAEAETLPPEVKGLVARLEAAVERAEPAPPAPLPGAVTELVS